MTAINSWFNDLRSFTRKADNEAERRFPNQARDNSQKNAFRHALGAGRLAQLLGANSGIPVVEPVARGLATLAGYGWEGLTPQSIDFTDLKHDLNANSIGISQASKTKDFNSLAESLAGFSKNARRESPPSIFQPARPYLTYTK